MLVKGQLMGRKLRLNIPDLALSGRRVVRERTRADTLNTKRGAIQMAQRTNGSVGERLRCYREQAGRSQVELAERAGISQPTYSRLENGTAQVSVAHLYLAAEALGVRPEVILGRAEQEERVLCAARTDLPANPMTAMKRRLYSYMEASAYLSEMGY